MDNKEYLESHPEYRSLFPTQEMYEDFVRLWILMKTGGVFILKNTRQDWMLCLRKNVNKIGIIW